MTALTAPPAAPAAAVTTGPVLGRRLAVTALVLGPVLNSAESIVARRYLDPNGTPEERAADIAAAELPLTLALAAGIVAIPLMLLAFQALAHLVRPACPRLAAAGAALTLVGCFGFLAIHVPSVIELAAVKAGEAPTTVAAVLTTVESSPIGVSLVLSFLLGLFGGVLVLSVGLWRSRAVPRWVPVALVAFLVLDFLADGRTGGIDPHPLWVAACLGAAAVVARRTDREWANG
ncbi:MAG TPA: DUF4386 family protein [Mycobacteriales bacterium]|nr:DUF4386 family protein [Mycobacteriales bacterium]